MHYSPNRIIHLRNDRKVFGPGWMCQTGDSWKDDYRFPNRGEKKIGHYHQALIHFLTHSFTPLYIQLCLFTALFIQLRIHSRRRFTKYYGVSQFFEEEEREEHTENKKEKKRNIGWELTSTEWIYITASANIFNKPLCAIHDSLCF